MTIQELTELRKKHGFTQQKIAEYLKVSKAYLSTIESGKRDASSSFLEKYRNAIQILSNNSENITLPNLVTQFVFHCNITNRLSKEDLNKALTILDDVKGNNQLEAAVYICLCIINRSTAVREYETAIQYAQKAIEYYRLNQDRYKIEYAEALFELAQTYMRIDKQVVAEEIYNMVNDLLGNIEPDHMFRYIALGNMAMISANFGRENESLKYIEICQTLTPNVRWCSNKWDKKTGEYYKYQMECVFFYTKANIAEGKEEYLFAIEEYKKCLQFMRNNVNYFDNVKAREIHTLDYIGNLYIKLGDYKNAEKYLLESITEKEKYPISHPSLYLEALNYLTKCYIHTEKYEQALMHAQKVLDYDSNDIIPKVIALRNLGRISNLKDHNPVTYSNYLEQAIQELSKHEAYHKLELYDELIQERLAIN